MKIKSTLLILALSLTTALAEPTPSPTPQPDKLKDALAQMIAGVTQTAGQAKDFIVGQLPDVVKQLLMWKFAKSIWDDLYPLVVFLITARIAYNCLTRLKLDEYDDPETNADSVKLIAGFVAAFIGLIALLGFFKGFNLDWLQIWIAPKVYLIDYAKSLVK